MRLTLARRRQREIDRLSLWLAAGVRIARSLDLHKPEPALEAAMGVYVSTFVLSNFHSHRRTSACSTWQRTSVHRRRRTQLTASPQRTAQPQALQTRFAPSSSSANSAPSSGGSSSRSSGTFLLAAAVRRPSSCRIVSCPTSPFWSKGRADDFLKSNRVHH